MIMDIKRCRDINIPLDLTVEILKKLPAKSLARFRCVSTEWESIINKFIVINSIVTRCLTKPPRDLHFILNRWSLLNTKNKSSRFTNFSYSYLYPQITNEEQLYDGYIFESNKGYGSDPSFQYVRGLIGFQCSDNGPFRIHNPTTRQFVTLPVTCLPATCIYLFGYDPFENQYKVVWLKEQSCQVFTLGDPTKQWRDIQCSLGFHFRVGEAVCINGAIYYKASTKSLTYHLMSFDVRSEVFYHIQAPEDLWLRLKRGYVTFVNYHEKLGCISRIKLNENDVDMWLMETAGKQEWSKVTFVAMLQDLPKAITCAGVTHPGGEMVLVSQVYRHDELGPVVYYYDPIRNCSRRAKVQITTSLLEIEPRDCVRIWAVTDHVENIMPL
ncbi:unnamed protein product [Microthlaspi erraticum]|uniref:F-box domain-containing protein n=1 Tax=Microthlaspi erraticum TaxID=1685480 RepID=A0A6D2HTJ0_9BRAS|nr:unnamed protein product [Microthlaspi erraticum]CAA7043905.1 unnamed protein product [Microthlaspi erraticum]